MKARLNNPEAGITRRPRPYLLRRGQIAASWAGRRWSWVDPLKEVEAHRVALALGLTTRAEILAAQGRDFADTLEQLKAENETMRAMGLDPAVILPGAGNAPGSAPGNNTGGESADSDAAAPTKGNAKGK